MIKDSALEKWEYREHTRVKHELLRKYLYAWIIKLGRLHRKILFFDGFAGRGEYHPDLKLGSPIIALQVANELLEQCEKRNRPKYFDKFICIAIEKDPNNFNNLQKVMEREQEKLKFKENLQVELINNEFANVTNQVFKEVGQRIAPSFFFVDPFGFSGVPFPTVKNILSLPHTEIFFTFMSRDINRFLAITEIETVLDTLYPTSEWRDIYKIRDWRKRDQALKDLYIKCLTEDANVKYAWAFRVCMDEKYQTLYYLIHATNHFDGLKIMKDIMYKQSASPNFAYLGPKEAQYRNQLMLFEDDISSLKKYLLQRISEQPKTFRKILEETYMYTPFVGSHYKEAFRQLEKENKIKIDGKGPRGGFYDVTRISILHKNPNTLFILPQQLPKLKVHRKKYIEINGKKRLLVARVNDGSIITRFDKTPLPRKNSDVVCPHFLELKWAYGCPYDCSWCYLKGTFRFRPEGKSPVIKEYQKIEIHTRTFLEECETPEMLNTGEIADSLMGENNEKAFSKFIIPIFETQKRHKVLFLTKSSNIKNLLELESHNQVIMSFSLNAIPVADRWEKAPTVMERLEAAQKLYESEFEVRVRIDPMVPMEEWKKHYFHIIDLIFERFIPERITLGSLRGLQSTINGCTDKTWVKYLSEGSNWGRKVNIKLRYQMYSAIIQCLKEKYDYKNVALCKETLEMWKMLKMNFREIKCNCIW